MLSILRSLVALISGDSGMTQQSSQVHLMSYQRAKGINRGGGMVWGSRQGDTKARKSKSQKEVAGGHCRTLCGDGECPS